jgi:hypothetical protein
VDELPHAGEAFTVERILREKEAGLGQRQQLAQRRERVLERIVVDGQPPRFTGV